MAVRSSSNDRRSGPSQALSVVVATYNGALRLPGLLDALDRQDRPTSEFEVVVVVDGSTDGSLDLLDSRHSKYGLRVIEQLNGGRAAARNAGLRASDGDIILFLDDDMEPCSGMVGAHIRSHATNGSRAVIGAAPIETTPADGPVARYIERKFNAHLADLAARPGRLTFRDFYSGNFSVRRLAFVAAGGFDEDFDGYGNEDGELAIRLQRAGTELVYEPTACAVQRYTKAFVSLARDTEEKGRTAVVLAAKQADSLPALRLRRYSSRPFRFFLIALFSLDGGQRIAHAIQRITPEIERLGSSRLLGFWYRWTLEYFYWRGAFRALMNDRG